MVIMVINAVEATTMMMTMTTMTMTMMMTINSQSLIGLRNTAAARFLFWRVRASAYGRRHPLNID